MRMRKWGAYGLSVVSFVAGLATIYQALGQSAQQSAAQQPIVSGSNGNFNINQQGGTVSQTYINQAPPKLRFTQEIGNELLATIPKGQAITVAAVGSPSDWAVGIEIANFLQAHGYSLNLEEAGLVAPPPSHPLTWDTASARLIVAPSVR